MTSKKRPQWGDFASEAEPGQVLDHIVINYPDGRTEEARDGKKLDKLLRKNALYTGLTPVYKTVAVTR